MATRTRLPYARIFIAGLILRANGAIEKSRHEPIYGSLRRGHLPNGAELKFPFISKTEQISTESPRTGEPAPEGEADASFQWMITIDILCVLALLAGALVLTVSGCPHADEPPPYLQEGICRTLNHC